MSLVSISHVGVFHIVLIVPYYTGNIQLGHKAKTNFKINPEFCIDRAKILKF